MRCTWPNLQWTTSCGRSWENAVSNSLLRFLRGGYVLPTQKCTAGQTYSHIGHQQHSQNGSGLLCSSLPTHVTQNKKFQPDHPGLQPTIKNLIYTQLWRTYLIHWFCQQKDWFSRQIEWDSKETMKRCCLNGGLCLTRTDRGFSEMPASALRLRASHTH